MFVTDLLPLLAAFSPRAALAYVKSTSRIWAMVDGNKPFWYAVARALQQLKPGCLDRRSPPQWPWFQNVIPRIHVDNLHHMHCVYVSKTHVIAHPLRDRRYRVLLDGVELYTGRGSLCSISESGQLVAIFNRRRAKVIHVESGKVMRTIDCVTAPVFMGERLCCEYKNNVFFDDDGWQVMAMRRGELFLFHQGILRFEPDILSLYSAMGAFLKQLRIPHMLAWRRIAARTSLESCVIVIGNDVVRVDWTTMTTSRLDFNIKLDTSWMVRITEDDKILVVRHRNEISIYSGNRVRHILADSLYHDCYLRERTLYFRSGTTLRSVNVYDL